MSLVVVALLVALALGWARGGSLDRLGALPVRSRRLVVAALLAQLTGTLVGGPLYPVGLAASAGLVLGFLARNRGIRGTGLVAAGLLANALVVGLNGAMPVSAEAASRAGTGLSDVLLGDRRHELAGPGTRLALLGDVVPVPLPLRPEVVSAGDVVVAAGLAQLLVLGMTGTGATDRATARTTDRVAGHAEGRPRRPLPPLPSWTTVARDPVRRPPAPSARPRPGARRPSAGS